MVENYLEIKKGFLYLWQPAEFLTEGVQVCVDDKTMETFCMFPSVND
jgi:hypothetical protein